MHKQKKIKEKRKPAATEYFLNRGHIQSVVLTLFGSSSDCRWPEAIPDGDAYVPAPDVEFRSSALQIDMK
jgi:hypothetical protein